LRPQLPGLEIDSLFEGNSDSVVQNQPYPHNVPDVMISLMRNWMSIDAAWLLTYHELIEAVLLIIGIEGDQLPQTMENGTPNRNREIQCPLAVVDPRTAQEGDKNNGEQATHLLHPFTK